MLFAMSDLVWQAIIAGLVTVILAWMQQRAANKAEEVRLHLVQTTAAVQRTADVAADKLNQIAEVGQSTHQIVNSQRSEMVDQIDELKKQRSEMVDQIDEMKKIIAERKAEDLRRAPYQGE